MGKNSKRNRPDKIDDLYRKIEKLKRRRCSSSSSTSLSSQQSMAGVSDRHQRFYDDEDNVSVFSQDSSDALRDNLVGCEADDPEVHIEAADIEVLEVAVLNEETAELLGESAVPTDGSITFHPELSSRVSLWMQDGMKKDDKMHLFSTYPRKGSVLLEAPILNPEVESTVSDAVEKRDKFFAADQNLVDSAISAIGVGLSLLLVKKDLVKNDRDSLIKSQLDAMKLLSEAHLQATKARRAYILLRRLNSPLLSGSLTTQ